MKTRIEIMQKPEVAGLLVLALAILMLSGCANAPESSRTMDALLRVPALPHEPITQIAFNTIDPYAPRLQAIEAAGGSPVFLANHKGLPQR